MKWQFASGRAQFGLVRALRRGILLAVAAGLVAASSAGAVTYPKAGGNGFTTGLEGWSGTLATCNPPLLCTEQNFWSATQGKPRGSLESRLDVLVNGGQLFQGKATWQSPSFVATASGAGSLRYDRQLDVSGLATLNPASSMEPVLIDATTGDAESLGTAVLSSGNSTFQTRTVSVPEDTLSPGDRYRLELRSTTVTSSAQVGLTGSISLRVDNLALRVKNEGPDGSAGSSGVKFTGPPLSRKQIKKMILNLNWSAEVGKLPGGSIVARRDCTIVGTPHRDRITGSSGNDVICAMGGNDRINGEGGRDIIDTGRGNDRVVASRGKDAVAGLAGRDRLFGSAGSDRIGGGAANDRLAGGSSRDRINGGAGHDRVIGARHDRITRVERGT
jgi:hemolysin type calcium-binding protein